MSGGYTYKAGTSGTVSVPAGQFVKTITARSTAPATVKIAGGDDIALPGTASAPTGFDESFDASRELLPGPIDIVFTSTDSYFVSWGP